MRPFLVLVLTVGLLAGTKWFLGLNPQVQKGSSGAVLIQAPGEYSVDVTLSFDAGPDEFALDVSDAPSLLVQMNGKEVLRRTDAVLAADSPIKVDSISGAVIGVNEFFVQASPSNISELKANAARVQVLRDGAVVAQKTLWSAAGDVLQGTVELKIDDAESASDSDSSEASDG